MGLVGGPTARRVTLTTILVLVAGAFVVSTASAHEDHDGPAVPEGGTPAWTEDVRPALDSDLSRSQLGPGGDVLYTVGHAEPHEGEFHPSHGDGGDDGNGTADDPDAGALLLRATDAATGERLWELRLPGPGTDGFATGTDLAVDGDGDHVYVTGTVRADPGNLDPFVMAVEADSGGVAWSHRMVATASASPASLVAPAGDGPLVVSVWEHRTSGDELRLVGIDASDGQEAWRESLPAPGTQQPLWMAAGPEGDRVYAALFDDASPTGLSVAAVATNVGQVTWRTELPGDGGEGWGLPSDRLAVSPDGDRVLAVGASGPATGPRQAAVHALDASSGEIGWSTTLTDDAEAVEDPVAVDVGPAGETAVVATALRTGDAPKDTDARVAAIAADTGDVTAERVLAQDGDEHPLDVQVGPEGVRAYATGWSAHDGAKHPWTAGLDVADANEAWTWTGEDHVHHDAGGGLAGSAWDVAVSPNASRAQVTVRDADDGASSLASVRTGLVHDATLEPQLERLTVGPQGEATYPVRVTAANLPTTLDLAVEDLEPGWTATVEDEDGDRVTAVELAPGETRELTLRVFPPTNALTGSSWGNLTATPVDDPTRGGQAATHTTLDPTGPPGDPTARPASLAPPCPWLSTHAGEALPAGALPNPFCHATDALTWLANETLPDEGAREGDEGPGVQPPDARMDRWWNDDGEAGTRAEDEVRGPRDHAGEWETHQNTSQSIVHAALQEDGRVVYWASLGGSQIWNPDKGRADNRTSTNTWLFCSSTTVLPDGTTYAAGGTAGIFPFVGRVTSEWFDLEREAWERGPNMSYERWYPSSVTMADGDVAIFSGVTWSEETGGDLIEEVEVYDPETDTYEERGERAFPLYPQVYSTASGKLVVTGPQETTARYDPRTGNFESVADRTQDGRKRAGSVVLDAEDGTVLEFGGALNNGTSIGHSAEVFDGETETWTRTGTLTYGREHPQAVLSPNGNVFAIGGEAHDHGNGGHAAGGESSPVETWDDDTGTWITGADPGVQFAHHGTGLLLPDGSVVATNQHDGEIRSYHPWYFFVDHRPQLADTPDELGYGTAANVVVEPEAGVDGVTAVRAGATTHSMNTDQRRVPLDTVTLPGYPALRVQPTELPGEAPPGPYILFAMDDDIPSEGEIASVGQGAPEVPAYPSWSDPIVDDAVAPSEDKVDQWEAEYDVHADHHQEAPEEK